MKFCNITGTAAAVTLAAALLSGCVKEGFPGAGSTQAAPATKIINSGSAAVPGILLLHLNAESAEKASASLTKGFAADASLCSERMDSVFTSLGVTEFPSGLQGSRRGAESTHSCGRPGQVVSHTFSGGHGHGKGGRGRVSPRRGGTICSTTRSSGLLPTACRSNMFLSKGLRPGLSPYSTMNCCLTMAL